MQLLFLLILNVVYTFASNCNGKIFTEDKKGGKENCGEVKPKTFFLLSKTHFDFPILWLFNPFQSFFWGGWEFIFVIHIYIYGNMST